MAGCVAACLCMAAPAAAAVPSSLSDPSNCTTIEPADGYAFVKCDDGVPAQGGETANPDGALAVTVPAKYRGYKRLPRKALDAGDVPGADAHGNVALDVDVSLPSTPPGRHGYPLLFLMHGCCSGSKASWESESFDDTGEKWHYSNAWFASRGYAVVTYTARGFVDGTGQGLDRPGPARLARLRDQRLPGPRLPGDGRPAPVPRGGGAQGEDQPQAGGHHRRLLRRRVQLAGDDRSEVALPLTHRARGSRQAHEPAGERAEVRLDRPGVLAGADRDAHAGAREAAGHARLRHRPADLRRS